MADQREGEKESDKEGEKDVFKQRFETICGIVLAVLAMVLAINELGAGKYGDDELIAHNQHTTQLGWYNAKSVKESLTEGQLNLLKSLMLAGTVQNAQRGAVDSEIKRLEAEIGRYKKEKKEILLGSEAVGKENWVQDIDGELGKVVGAKEWEVKAQQLGDVGDRFDQASLFLQICLVLGALSLVIDSERMKKIFFMAMLIAGLIGTFYSVVAYRAAWLVP